MIGVEVAEGENTVNTAPTTAEVFASCLRHAMDGRGLKQADLIRMAADRGSKLGKSQVSQYVSGKTLPRRAVVQLLADILEIEPFELTGESWAAEYESMPAPAPAARAKSAAPAALAPAAPDDAATPASAAPATADGAPALAPAPAALATSAFISSSPAMSDPPGRAEARPAAAFPEPRTFADRSTSSSHSEGNIMSENTRTFKKSSKLDNVLYDVRGPVVDEAARLESEGAHILKLNIGNPAPFGFRTPFEVIQDMREQLPECEGYSDSRGLFSARKAIMQYAQLKGLPNVSMDGIYTGNGVSELINLCMQALLDTGDEILIPSPDYPLWTACATLAGGTPVHYRCDEQADWNPDLADMEAKITPRTKAVVIINPNNPTGAVYAKEVLEGIVEIARKHQLMIFADEIYDRLCMDDAEHVSIASLAPDLFCVTFSGLSKSHMIAGYRIGWMIVSGNKRLGEDFMLGVNMLSNMRLCSNVPAQSIVQTALGGHQSVKSYVAPGGRVCEQRNYVYEALNAIDGITAVKPKAAFYIFPKMDVKKFNIRDDEQFALDLLHQKGILITRGGGFNWPEPDHFRIVYLPPMDVLREAMEDLAEFFETYRQR
ncbi:aminotransferase class I/II-fold pyridoxal phosphate-dependent enzyme [Collinsella intestinalis]|uniref:alanine transaminase n=2 Tax=Collinsella intestinalis TaxID=147207 RepID=A0A414FX40_9ACTN|nr:aminotransferase class I/II-fold pyridoxal phosphate-dependent enzyme [Collinsella intestinalis]RHD56041.1 aminotransferase class I/II-fold pyridoxal phosphate-dependent enzyme [Collinsella intestinalis]